MSGERGSPEQSSPEPRSESPAEKSTQGGSGSRRKPTLVTVLQRAAEQFRLVTNQEVESVSSVVPSEEGWDLQVEVVELARIPETTSVMASYSVELDAAGHLVGYRRVRRYSRSQLDS